MILGTLGRDRDCEVMPWCGWVCVMWRMGCMLVYQDDTGTVGRRRDCDCEVFMGVT